MWICKGAPPLVVSHAQIVTRNLFSTFKGMTAVNMEPSSMSMHSSMLQRENHSHSVCYTCTHTLYESKVSLVCCSIPYHTYIVTFA